MVGTPDPDALEPDPDALEPDPDALEPDPDALEPPPTSDTRLSNPQLADRLAWSMLESLSVYQEETVQQGIQEGRFYAALGDDLWMNFRFFEDRISPALDARRIFFDAVETWRRACYRRAGRTIPEEDLLE